MHKFITRISAFFLRRSHKLENLTYLSIWLLVIVLYLVEAMRISGMDMYYMLGWKNISMMAVKLAPFMLLFAFNNWVLMPRLLFRNHISGYFLALFTTIFVMWGWQYYYQQTDLGSNSADVARYLDNPSGSLLSMRAMLNGIYSFLIAGINIAIALIFRMIDDRIEHERVMKSNAQEQLSYLRAQINPHFYMNMLNNIHGMIEINPVQAQEMVLEMSHLMRYMLYDSSQQVISLSSEIDFLENYIHIMRQRFPTEKVRISTAFPSIQKCKGVRIPPLLFLVFLENAFKHGISYSKKSYVDTSLSVNTDTVVFSCENSLHDPESNADSHVGIGLKNVRERLNLLYGKEYSLITAKYKNKYVVKLSINNFNLTKIS